MTPAAEILRDRIRSGGPLPFPEFLAIALYHPEVGYYAAGEGQVGRGGDFYTNVSVGPVFGQLLAGQFLEMWHLLDQPTDFLLVEQGAHDGRLMRDVLETLRAGGHEAIAAGVIIEPSPKLEAAQREMLAGFPVRWVRDVCELPRFTGVHFSNELIDALPFHLVRSTGEGWEVLRVGWQADHFAWVGEKPDDALCGEIACLPQREAGTLAEIRTAHQPLLAGLSERMARGWMLVVDYGMVAERLNAEGRKNGTFSCYSQHRRDQEVFEQIGCKDITAHVNFSQFAYDAIRRGWEVSGFCDQHHFLVGASASRLRDMDGQAPDAAASRWLRSLRTLLHPESMGTQFHALLLAKDAPQEKPSGFAFARPLASSGLLEGAYHPDYCR